MPLATAWCISIALLNGTLISSAPDICLSSSAARCVALPVPIDPTETLPGLAFANARISETVRGANEGAAVITIGPEYIIASGAKSLRMSNADSLTSHGCTTFAETIWPIV